MIWVLTLRVVLLAGDLAALDRWFVNSGEVRWGEARELGTDQVRDEVRQLLRRAS